MPPRSLAARIEALERRRGIGRTIYVREGDEEGMARALARAGPDGQVVTIRWLRPDEESGGK